MKDEYYNSIEQLTIDNEINREVKKYSINKNTLEAYYAIGKLLVEAQKEYNNLNIIKEYANKLTNNLGYKCNEKLLKNIRKFYSIIEKGAIFTYQLNWGHYKVLLKFKNIKKINYYIKLVQREDLSIRQLKKRIKHKKYESSNYHNIIRKSVKENAFILESQSIEISLSKDFLTNG